MQRPEYTLAYVKRAFDFISENILTALVLLPFLYVILFADLGGFVSELIPVSIFQDITVAIFLGVVIFGIAWVTIDELQKR
jgi:uncharacterized membrane protein (DUF485 family)